MSHHKVAILDPGAQYGKLIDKTVRSLGVESQIVDLAASNEELANYDAYIVAGGGASVNGADAPTPALRRSSSVTARCPLNAAT